MHHSLKQCWDLLHGYLQPQWARVLLLTLLIFGGIGLQLLNPQVIRFFIDTTQAGGAQRPLLLAAGAFLAIALGQQLLSLATVYVGEQLGWRATNRLRADLARHCLNLDMAFHKRYTPGALIERLDGDVTTLANFFSQLFVVVLGNALLIAGVLLLLFREDWRVGVGMTLYTLLALLALRRLQHIAVACWSAEHEARAQQFGFLEERISGAEDIRANGAEAYVMRQLAQQMRDFLRKNRAANLVSNITFVITNFLTTSAYALGLGFGAFLFSQGQASIGTAFLIVYYIGMLANPLDHIREQVQDLQQATAGIGRVSDLFQLEPRVKEQPRAALPPGAPTVEFAAVSFAYDEELTPGEQPTSNGSRVDQVLHDISFQLQPGKTLGLLGRTGSGKTTLTRLLFRLYDPVQGAIRLNGVDLRDLALADLRAGVGMVTQEVQLFQASIRDNLTFFERRISDAQIEAALRELQLWDWVCAQPDGLDTRLAAGGQSLSAGEAQLLAFARGVLKNPGLVILDEASSRLDPATERLLERAIDRLLTGHTGVIIAHRLQTVQRADEIVILEAGRIVEAGARHRLASDPASRFAALLRTGLEEVLA
jgi:ABC-type multidrug transport system fused ATPase/permease subunit